VHQYNGIKALIIVGGGTTVMQALAGNMLPIEGTTSMRNVPPTIKLFSNLTPFLMGHWTGDNLLSILIYDCLADFSY
jgi:hypothetical protein